jgi:methylmalonyl-CoA/ethylmalonyl-CoA epimerase
LLSGEHFNQIRQMISEVRTKQRRDALAPSLSRLGLLAGGNAALHHLGFVVSSISAVGEEFAASMSAHWDSEIVYDPIQRVRVSFFHPSDARNPVYELVEPAGDASPVSAFLRKGGGLHHVCYEIDDLERNLTAAHLAGFVVLTTPAPAVAFFGRKIAWICSRTKNPLLVELLER